MKVPCHGEAIFLACNKFKTSNKYFNTITCSLLHLKMCATYVWTSKLLTQGKPETFPPVVITNRAVADNSWMHYSLHLVKTQWVTILPAQQPTEDELSEFAPFDDVIKTYTIKHLVHYKCRWTDTWLNHLRNRSSLQVEVTFGCLSHFERFGIFVLFQLLYPKNKYS